jgi:hypothetical protein
MASVTCQMSDPCLVMPRRTGARMARALRRSAALRRCCASLGDAGWRWRGCAGWPWPEGTAGTEVGLSGRFRSDDPRPRIGAWNWDSEWRPTTAPCSAQETTPESTKDHTKVTAVADRRCGRELAIPCQISLPGGIDGPAVSCSRLQTGPGGGGVEACRPPRLGVGDRTA